MGHGGGADCPTESVVGSEGGVLYGLKPRPLAGADVPLSGAPDERGHGDRAAREFQFGSLRPAEHPPAGTGTSRSMRASYRS